MTQIKIDDFRKFRNHYILFLWLTTLALTFSTGKIFSLSYTKLPNGWFSSIHVITVDPKEYHIYPVRAADKDGVARETVAAIAQKQQASAAINGGFWKANGDPAGVLKIDKSWYGNAHKLRGAIGWSDMGTHVLMDRIRTKNEATHELESAEGHLAEAWKDLQYIVGGVPLLVKDAKVIEDFSPEQALQTFIINKHPRTAVGITDTGKWKFVVVDGRFLGFFGGMTIPKLAQLMRNLGCVDAVNLDGGGSSTLVLSGRVINRPCGPIREKNKWVEKISDAIVIVPRDL